MKVFNIFLISLSSLGSNKLRAGLALLGIVIGISAVIILMSIGRGVQNLIISGLEDLGTNLVLVWSSPPDDKNFVPNFTLSDSYALIDSLNAPSVMTVAPEKHTFRKVAYSDKFFESDIVGVTGVYSEVRNLSVSKGMFITDIHTSNINKVAVLGSRVSETLFDENDPIGKRVRIGKSRFTVIGVLESKDSSGFGSDANDMTFVPITSLHSYLAKNVTSHGDIAIDFISVKANSPEEVDSAMAETAKILRLRHRITGDDDFIVTSQKEILAMLQVAIGAIVFFLVSIAAISLLVGGIGIMNIMLVSVTERTREIGIRKALGAKRMDILLQFVMEAVFLTIAGGLLGILIGYFCSMLLDGIPIGDQELRTAFDLPIALIAIGVSGSIGLFFGIFPAYRASKLHPIDALRYQ